jgi:predicted O-linked N-acetylglucosamine transferase (SPINDLY family)
MSAPEATAELLNRLIDLFNAGEFNEAEAQARSLADQSPLMGHAWLLLGASQQAQGKSALPALERAVSLLPDSPDAHFKLGVHLEQEGQLEAAGASFRQALLLDPWSTKAHCLLGHALRKQGFFEEALESYRAVLAIDPTHYDANLSLHSALSREGRLVEAEELCRRTLAFKPDFEEMRQLLAKTLAFLSNYTDVVKECDLALEGEKVNPVTWEQRLYCFSYHPDLSAEDIYHEFVRWGDRFPEPLVDFRAHDRNPKRRLRIGYVSPDFRKHTSRFYFWPLFQNHDRASFELFAYSNVQHEVAWTRQFRGQFEHWRDIWGVDDETVAAQVRADGIDILVDLCGHMGAERLGLFALKPAPIQAYWLGSAWTTGLKTMDYVLFDPYVAPEGTLTRETIIRLPHSFMVFQPEEGSPDLVVPPCLRNGCITFGYTGRTERLNHLTFRVWGEILRRLPDARLILDFPPFADPRTQAHYRAILALHGVDTDRLIMRKSSNIFEGLNDIDILLDSFPHGGGTMLLDSYWMGVPALTLASRPPVGRLGLGMAMNLGLPEWVAYTEEEFIEKACGFAADRQALKDLRLGMRERMQNSPLMDGLGFARSVEAAYRAMFERWTSEEADLKTSSDAPVLEPGGGA